MKVSPLLSLFCCLVQVTPQTFPYVSFRSASLLNHSYIDFNLVGDDLDGSDSVQCHTDLGTCCRGNDPNDGNWYSPQRMVIGPTEVMGNISVMKAFKRVDLRRRGNEVISGIYECIVDIMDGQNFAKGATYVGLYSETNGG